MGKTYVLKVRDDIHRLLCSGAKKDEVRFDDRGFTAGDYVELVPEGGGGNKVRARIDHVIPLDDMGGGMGKGLVFLCLSQHHGVGGEVGEAGGARLTDTQFLELVKGFGEPSGPMTDPFVWGWQEAMVSVQLAMNELPDFFTLED